MAYTSKYAQDMMSSMSGGEKYKKDRKLNRLEKKNKRLLGKRRELQSKGMMDKAEKVEKIRKNAIDKIRGIKGNSF